MKAVRTLALVLALILCTAVLLTACGNEPADTTTAAATTTAGTNATTTATPAATTTAATTTAVTTAVTTTNVDNEVGAGDIFD